MARILRGLSSRQLRCGCVLGIYETYEGTVVGLIDAKGSSCAIRAHDGGNVLPVHGAEAESPDTQTAGEN
jgi:hypothetical protein